MKGGHSIFLTGRQISALEIAAAKSASSRVAFEQARATRAAHVAAEWRVLLTAPPACEQGGKRIVLNLEHLNRLHAALESGVGFAGAQSRLRPAAQVSRGSEGGGGGVRAGRGKVESRARWSNTLAPPVDCPPWSKQTVQFADEVKHAL